MAKGRITQTELAKLAGVSQKTIYRALHGKGRISAKTAALIENIAKENNYRIDQAAHTMVTGKYHNIAILTPGWHLSDVPDAAEDHPDKGWHTPQEYLAGINETLVDSGYCLSMSYVAPYAEQQVVSGVFDHLRFDGVISFAEIGPAIANVLDELELSCVSVNATRHSEHNAVLADDVLGAQMLTEYLINRGHKRIGFIGGSPMSGRYLYDSERREGYLKALANAGLQPHTSLDVRLVDDQRRDYWRNLLTSDEDKPTAFVTMTSASAVYFIRIARTLGLTYAKDFELVSFDDSDEFALLDPPITTLALPEYEMGQTAAEMILQLVSGECTSVATRVVPPTLIDRRDPNYTLRM